MTTDEEYTDEQLLALFKCRSVGETFTTEDSMARRILFDRLSLLAAPIPMVLHCPACGLQHIDAPDGEWTNPPHRSHLCARCGLVWRPADVTTTGVAGLKTRGERDVLPPYLDTSPALAAPPGWKLVPVEPTEEMIAAAVECLPQNGPAGAGGIYSEMLAASPSPSTPQLAWRELSRGDLLHVAGQYEREMRKCSEIGGTRRNEARIEAMKAALSTVPQPSPSTKEGEMSKGDEPPPNPSERA